MTTEAQGPETLEDLCRDKRVPLKLKNDRAQMEIGKLWTSNEAERATQEVKKMVNLIMDHTGCPNSLWVMRSLYVVFLLNHLAQPNL